MKNNRLYSRYTIRCYGDITDNKYRNIRFVMNDISAGGMNITTEQEITDEKALTIHLDMTKILLPRKQLKGVIVRKKKDQSSYNYGIRFHEISHMEIVEIDEYLRFRHYSALVHIVENPSENIYLR